MARPLRLEHPGAIWHISSRGNNRGDIFFDDADRLLFLGLLGEAVLRFHWLVHVYVLMTNHFHIVIETPEMTLSRGMKWLKQKYVQRVNRKYKRTGSLFEGRFDSQLVERESHLLEVLRYTVLNPVRAFMVQRPEDYRWSSYRATVGLEEAPSWLTTSWTLSHFGQTLEAQQAGYAQFVDAGVGLDRSPFEDVVAQLFLGTRPWIKKMQEITDSKPRNSEHPAAQRYAGRPTVDQVIADVALVFRDSVEGIRTRHGGNERRFVAWLCTYETHQRYAKVAAALRLRSTSRVAALVAECGIALKDPLLSISMDRCVDLLRGKLQVLPTIHREEYPGSAYLR
jgi:REP element-mobilizing transposase RayT